MNILFIAPIPPVNSERPITGNSLPIIKTIEYLRSKGHYIDTIDLSHADVITKNYFKRALQILLLVFKAYLKSRKAEIIYLTIAESFTGNIRDLFIYSVCHKKIGNIIIHMLGGNSIGSIINNSKHVLFPINKYYLNRIKAIIVEGKDQMIKFNKIVPRDKIHIIQNFAENYLVFPESKIEQKFENVEKIELLFLSNFLEGKGYWELAKAYMSLSEEMKKYYNINFVGNFIDVKEKERFIEYLKQDNRMHFLGPRMGLEKRDIYWKSHVFCLPTYYAYEGQPFCIVEAYAAGCMVITTDHSGIKEVFTPMKNGLQVEKKSIESLSNSLVWVVENRNQMVNFSRHNLSEAHSKYSLDSYLERIEKLLYDDK